MIPLILIDAKAERSAVLQQRLLGSGTFRVLTSAAPEVTLNRHLTESNAVIVAVHEDSQNGLAFITSLRDRGVDLPVILLAASYDPGVFYGAVTRRAECMMMEGPIDAWYPVLACLIDKVCTVRQLSDRVTFLEKKLNLVGSVTRHDVLNQLTAVGGYTELLEMVITDPEARTFIEKERTALEKIRRQFRFAKEYQNLATEPPHWQSLSAAVRRAGESVALNGIPVEESYGKVMVYADIALEKAISYLLENAIRYGGQVSRIRITLRDEPPGAVLVVEDNGTGIPAEDKEHIFERGFGKGTGWGLFLVREILAITGITIAETGEPGKGARFDIRIPAEAFRKEGE